MRRIPVVRRAVLGAVVASAVGTVAAAVTHAEELAPTPYGIVEDFEPGGELTVLPGLGLEPEGIRSDGATVTTETCTVRYPPLFVRTIQTEGQLIVTPSGQVTLVCHVRLAPRDVRSPIEQAVVVQEVPCRIGDDTSTRDSQIVLTPNLDLHVVCHTTLPA